MENSHPIRPPSLSSLPPEIVAIILHHLANPQDQELGRGYDDLIRTTLSNSYIRQVAIATPSLWTRIEIADSPVSFELAKACLDRSGTQKLNVAIRIAIRVGPKLPGVFALVKHVAGRIRELRLQIGLSKPTQWMQLDDFLDTLELPVLEDLAMNFWDPKETALSTRPIPLPKDAATLRSISLVHLRPVLPSPAIRQLQHISLSWPALENWHLAHLWAILAQAERLETLELVGKGTNDVVRSELPLGNRDGGASAMPRLRRLTLGGLDSGLMAHLLLGLEAPNLVEVSLLILGFKDTWSARYPWIDVTAIHPMPSVTTLDISFSPRIGPYTCIGAPLPKFLRNIFPDIEHLSLPRYSADFLLPFWADMWENGNALPHASCWPLLRRLTASGSDGGCDRKCKNNLKICGSFLAMRARRSLPALEEFFIELCVKGSLDPEFERCMGGVQRLVKKVVPLRVSAN
ncbi:hypothetical protein FS837_000845 [Tulasnella sp. UAMH 9824]|nr:hypothetical protein FS837_000845 [Tulasnella sp. UAMH 9824]